MARSVFLGLRNTAKAPRHDTAETANVNESIAETVENIARRLDRLTVSRANPDAFFEDRSEMAQELREQARRLRRVGS